MRLAPPLSYGPRQSHLSRAVPPPLFHRLYPRLCPSHPEGKTAVHESTDRKRSILLNHSSRHPMRSHSRYSPSNEMEPCLRRAVCTAYLASGTSRNPVKIEFRSDLSLPNRC